MACDSSTCDGEPTNASSEEDEQPDQDLDPKPVDGSRCTMTEMVLPNDTNGLGNLMGGRLLHLMDVCAAIVAQRHAERVCVTASVDTVEFRSAIHLGEVILVKGFINRAFRSSMEIELRVWAENPREGTRRRCNTAYYTFVGVDDDGQPVRVPPVDPQTREQKERYDAAGRRRELRLIMSGRLDLSDATNLRARLEAAIQQE
jgi:acyl-CoA hydrolase